MITHAVTSVFYQVGCETTIIADASPVDLGAVIAQLERHVWRVVAYASRSLSVVEKR